MSDEVSGPEFPRPDPMAGVPRLPPGTIPRRRLLDQLSTDAALVVLRGRGGTGKTALVAQWLRSGGLDRLDPPAIRVAWVTTEPSASSRASYWLQVLDEFHALGLVRDRDYQRDSIALNGSGSDVDAAVRRLLTRCGEGLLLVLDDFGPPGDFWDEVVTDLVTGLRATSDLRVVAIGRSPTSLEDPLVQISLPMRILTDDHLTLTRDEQAAIVDASHLDLEPEARAALLDAPDSTLPMILRYLLALLRNSTEPDQRISSERLRHVLRPAVQREFSRRVPDPAMLRFLEITAQAPYFDEALARTLTQEESAADLLARAERGGAGHWTSSRGRTVFRYSDHVRATAASLDSKRRAPEAVRATLSEVSRWLAEQDDTFTALEYALRAEDLDHASTLLARVFAQLTWDSGQRIAALVEELPVARVHLHPILAMYRGLMLNAQRGSQLQALEYFASAAVMSRARGSKLTPGERAVLWVQESAAMRLLGQQNAAAHAARKAAKVVERDADHVLDELAQTTSTVLVQAGYSLFYAEGVASAEEVLQRSRVLARQQGWAPQANRSHADLAAMAAFTGCMRDARELLALIDPEAWPENWLNGYHGAMRNIAEAWVAINEGRFPDATAELAVLRPHFDAIEHWELIASPLALADTLAGRGAAAEAWFNTTVRDRTNRRTPPSVVDRASVTSRLLALVTGSSFLGASVRRNSPVAAQTKALESLHLTLAGQDAAGVASLAAAESRAVTALDRMLVAVAGLAAAHRGAADLDPATLSGRVLAILSADELRWPLALLGSAERERMLAEVDAADRNRLAEVFSSIPSLVPATPRGAAHVALTPRERLVLQELTETGSRAELAERLFTSPNTVKSQLRTLYRKLDVSSREEALAKAVTLGLLGGDDARKAG